MPSKKWTPNHCTFTVLWEDFGGRTGIPRPACKYLPCLSGWKDTPKNLAVRLHRLLFSKSVFLKTKYGAMLLWEFTKTIWRPQNGDSNLTCSADPYTKHYFMLCCLPIVFRKDEKCKTAVAILIQRSAACRRRKNRQNCSGSQSGWFELELHRRSTILAGLAIQGLRF